LQDIIASKQHSNRPKDHEALLELYRLAKEGRDRRLRDQTTAAAALPRRRHQHVGCEPTAARPLRGRLPSARLTRAITLRSW
jgi:hypothetical protein